MVTSKLRKAKKEYFNAFVQENQNNIKETWKGIRNLINVSKKSTNSINKLDSCALIKLLYTLCVSVQRTIV